MLLYPPYSSQCLKNNVSSDCERLRQEANAFHETHFKSFIQSGFHLLTFWSYIMDVLALVARFISLSCPPRFYLLQERASSVLDGRKRNEFPNCITCLFASHARYMRSRPLSIPLLPYGDPICAPSSLFSPPVSL